MDDSKKFYEQVIMEAEAPSFLKFAKNEAELKEKLSQGKIYRLNNKFFQISFWYA